MRGPPPWEEFALKETSPAISGAGVTGNKLTCTYDLVEQMRYLYVCVVKAKELSGKEVSISCDPYKEVKLGNYKGATRHFENKTNPEWNQVFAFSKDQIQASIVEVVVKDKDFVKDDTIGRVIFYLSDVPKRVPPDRPLAPQWYRLEDVKGGKAKGELMLAVWMGTQADEAFPEAWHFDAASVSGEAVTSIRLKVYLSPKLWYVKINVIEAQELVLSNKSRFPEVYIKVMLGNQALRTRTAPGKSLSPLWNEDLLFVAAEPIEEPLVVSVEYRVGPGNDEGLGMCVIPLQNAQRRLDHKPVNSSSDLRPTAKPLWKSSIGTLVLGIPSAHGLMRMKIRDGQGAADAYCVAKYGQKWVRTRTIIDSLNPKWNEQYTWEIFDPCNVVTIGVFDNV
ncbi:hypothetical protein Nepgr_001915 [Nepenthes gracilis]|uniref:C2 domain-containing protein n=1 Tax=Nepenthes gracilis TaxID=150966 RepID=A0AAD3P5W7_NEPGR|nr:hypothetical protein Nepgr_001915 [Nepenthes gracilis]